MRKSPRPRPRPRGLGVGAPSLAVAAAALLAAWVLGFGFIASAAPTFDEPAYLGSGYSALRTGDFRVLGRYCPPFGKMWSALPLLLLGPQDFVSSPDWREARPYHYGDLFLYHNTVPAERLLGAARAFDLLTWTALLFATLFLWGRRLGGEIAGAAAVAAAALCPVLLSNFSLATADAAPTALWFLTFFLLDESFAAGPATALTVAAGACAGLAAAAKFSMCVVPPLALALAAADQRLRARPWREIARGSLAFAAPALLVLAAVYHVSGLPQYWRGLGAMSDMLTGGGYTSFLFGRYGVQGSWLYFPAAFLVKTPVALLALGALGAAAWAREFRAGRLRRETLWVWGPAAVYAAAAGSSTMNVGVRHILPIIPAFLLIAGFGAADVWRRRRGKTAVLLFGVWAAASVLGSAPHLLAYFNELVGGPARGYLCLADSNLDWGQDLRGLARYLRARGDPPVYLSYFGTADPGAEGVRYVPVACSPHVERPGDPVDPAAQGRALFAISATNLQGVYFADHGVFEWLKSRRPVAAFGYSIFLYDLGGDADGRRRLARLLAQLGRPRLAASLARMPDAPPLQNE